MNKTTDPSKKNKANKLKVKLTPETFTNRELSNIEFNRRVLEMAKDTNVPLLERLKFIAIVGSNLDEFFMVRVGSYVNKMEAGITRTRPDGYTAAELIYEIRRRVMTLMTEQRAVMSNLLKDLEDNDLFIKTYEQVNPIQQEALRAYFYDEVFPVLTPLAADHARPFPFISNLSLNIGIYVRRIGETNEHLEFVRLKVPEALPRLVNLGEILEKYTKQDNYHGHFLWIEDIIAHNLDLLFPGMDVIEYHPFRVTRNADIDYEHEREEELEDISAIIEAGVRDRRFGAVMRLSVPTTISSRMLDRLIQELSVVPDRDVYMIDGALGSANLFQLASADRPDLKYTSYVPRVPAALVNAPDIFSAIRRGDILLHHPYESFGPVEEFFDAAAHDPAVIAIKATLYRVGKNSPIVQSLLVARENDKQVAVLVELKARFDEENNLEWARALEQNGVHVIYGVEKLAVKTHAKVAMVVRKEGGTLRRYVHLGTGNYNPSTARLYTDLGLFTTHEQIAEDASRLFNRLTGYAPDTNYKRLLVAPEYLLDALERLVDNEIEAAKAGKPAYLVFKMNQFEEDRMIQKLYEASQAGVQIDLIVRGLCCLRAGVPDVSENIRVISILGRFLEHPRIYYFHNAPPEHQLYAGSADLMRRNLYNRVEVVWPVLEEMNRRKVLRILVTALKANVHTWYLEGDKYIKKQVSKGEKRIESQQTYMRDSAGLNADLIEFLSKR